ncbi:exodeoxyribonuclease V subunit gamma [Methylomicrobium lacus]|uniref:exodeoxyribonuclease V subunit gamma n=1 Tax=Methylomicrobium lacus TaxID=136992 RepID=UPI00045E9658|nr:exodeoxyribonuclease V subunit gamma [Methylomicrobium lacus]
MTESSPLTPLDSGIAVIHSNQLEELRDVVAHWLRQHPLMPLEQEVFLVQSNGMGQWLKQNLAQNSALSVAAAIQMQLPSLFIWSVYRAVLGEKIPLEQPLAKAPLTWRLYRLLPTLVSQSGFETLKTFLADDRDSRKRYQLSEQLADLFDQYQVYRSDWLTDWAKGENVLRDSHGKDQSIPDAQCWQADLWRAVLADLGSETVAPFASRAAVHAQFMDRIKTLKDRPPGLPRRIILFGLSSLPQQSLEVLEKLGKFCQIVLFVHNPCRHYWADIIEDKDLLKAERRRQTYKDPAKISNTGDLHLDAQPLLAAWGKQGRDYIRLLDHYDEKQRYQDWNWQDNKIDLFVDYGESPDRRTLLQHLQQSILDLEPLPSPPALLERVDDSIVFHVAHSRQREVEILHDRLLARFEASAKKDSPLSPRDVIVMVPDINAYAPHIRAVFGLYPSDDPRHIPYSLADRQQRGNDPLLTAIESLLDLPDSRFTVSEYLDLLEVGTLRARFKIEESAIPKLHQWIEEAGIRWGLNAEQRARIVNMPKLEANTWQFGLRRMLLGYAVGAGEAFGGIEPYEEIGGLDAQWLGGLAFLLEALENYARRLAQPQSFSDWRQTLQSLLDDFFIAGGEAERKTLDSLTEALETWGRHCKQAGLGPDDKLPIQVAREAWLAGVDEPSLHQRFLSGKVNFCTLMPMRAIPFRQICLLGMNDGDYPRNQQVNGFDLMSQRGQYRPGDRSRRQDDQYLFLEALLSAREQLYISWIGRSIRDDSKRPPSVLVGQLRDVLAQGWVPPNGKKLLDEITACHPLQPFSRKYVTKTQDPGPELYTYTKEWFSETAVAESDESAPVPANEKPLTFSPEFLASFLRAPVKEFCNFALKFGFDDETVTSKDHEPFQFEALQAYMYSNRLLDAIKNTNPDDVEAFLDHQQTVMAQKGELPLGGFAKAFYTSLTEPVKTAWDNYQALLSDWPTGREAHVITLRLQPKEGPVVELTGELSQLRRHRDHEKLALVYLTVQSLKPKEGIKYHNLMKYWVLHLTACAEGLELETYVAAADGILKIKSLDRAEASDQLQTLLYAVYQGMRDPLPIACKTAFAWLSALDKDKAQQDKAMEKARDCYEGSDWKDGEVAYDPYLARFFPTFEELRQADSDIGFEFWTETLYGPIFDPDLITHYSFATEAQS